MENKNEIDKSNLRQVILDSPKQFAVGLELAKNIKIPGNFKNVVVSGMGGSALPADILRDFLDNSQNSKIEIFQNRTYALPKEAYDNAVNFIVSYSGNTEETLSCLDETLKNNLPTICFANGGKVLEIAKAKNIPHITIPECVQPRYATGYFFGAMLQVLINLGLTNNSYSDILENSKKLEEKAINFEPKGQAIAKKMVNATPIIYTSDKFRSVGMVVKIKINENAKTPAFYNFYPELSHNEMLGFTLPQGNFYILAFLDKNDHPQIIKRIKITADLYMKKGIPTEVIEMESGNYFETIFSALIMGDWISYYLALEYGQDPTPVDMVEELKKLLT